MIDPTQIPNSPTPTGLPVEPGLPAVTQAPATPALDDAALQSLGQKLAGRFKDYAGQRRMAEIRWMQSARQFLGVYDPDMAIPKDRSHAYPRLTRVKVVSMVSRLMNLLFPSSEKNWQLTASPVPNLPADVMQTVLNQAFADCQQQGVELTDDIIQGYVVREASARAALLEKELEDQLEEIGGSHQDDYLSLCRKVIYSAVTYGCGIARGPFVRSQKQRQWARLDTGAFQVTEIDVKRPHYEFVPLWDYYPDMTAKSFRQQQGQFVRHVMSRHGLRKLADDPAFLGDKIREYLRDHDAGNYVRQTYETELKAMGVNANVNDRDSTKYEIYEWVGYVSGKELSAAGVDIPEDQLIDEHQAVVWVIDNTVIRAELDPWTTISPDQTVEMFHQFVFEEDETSILGNGLPNVMRDSQMNIALATRMTMDNAAVTCGPVLEVNTDLIRLDQDVQNVAGFKTFYREGTGADAATPAVRNVAIDSHIPELKSIIDMFASFADTETFIGPQTGGDMQRTPSEPMRTAAGASMLRGDAALPFKDVIRNFDRFTFSLLTSLLVFNNKLNPKAEIKGDAQVVPRGATSLMAKEMRGMALDAIAQTLTPDERAYLKPYEFVKERLAVRDVDLRAVLCTEEEAKVVDANRAKSQQEERQKNDALLQAEVRKILADAAKALTQSDKNAAAADVSRVNAMLDALEKGAGDGQNTGTNAAAGGPAGLAAGG